MTKPICTDNFKQMKIFCKIILLNLGKNGLAIFCRLVISVTLHVVRPLGTRRQKIDVKCDIFLPARRKGLADDTTESA